MTELSSHLEDTAALRARLGRIDRFIAEEYVGKGKLGGSLVQVWRRGELVLNSVQGKADLERDVAMTEDTIFRIYSMSKPVTSVALMMLLEEGRLGLGDPVSRYIPEWQDMGVYAGGALHEFQTRPPARPMQIIDLLRHTSGLTYGFQYRTPVDAAYRSLNLVSGDMSGTLEGMILELARLPLEFSPGEAWNYSVATDVVGYLVGKISGVPFSTFLADRIFGPLGMVDTAFHVPSDKIHRFAACYKLAELGRPVLPDTLPVLQEDPRASLFLKPPGFISGGGGLVSTAADYMRFARMLLGGGTVNGTRLLGRKTVELMTANHLPGGGDLPKVSRSLFSEATYQGIGFGLGFATTIAPGQTLMPGSRGEYFWGGSASTSFWIDPGEDLIVVSLAQLIPSSAYPLNRQLRTLVYSAL